MASSWLSSLNPVPQFPKYPGEYEVGTLDVEVPASELQNLFTRSHPTPSISTVAFRIFYPCLKPKSAGRPVRWLPDPQRKVVSAYVQFGGAGPGVSNIFSYVPQPFTHITIPAHDQAPLAPRKDQSEPWPVVVFSHGLGSNRNVYSYLCGSLASHGMIAVAAEHRDGSAPVSFVRDEDSGGQEPVVYRRISHTADPTVYAARDEQLGIRCWELSLIHQALLNINSGKPLTNLADPVSQSKKGNVVSSQVLDGFKGNLDVERPSRITWAGHSMGAATMVTFLKSVFYHSHQSIKAPVFRPRESSPLIKQVTPSSPVVLLDLWTLPLQSPANHALHDLPLPCFSPSGPGGSAVLAVLSEAFVEWRKNFDRVKQVLADPESARGDKRNTRSPVRMFYPVKSAHLSQSDFGLLFPRVVKYFAKAVDPERTMDLNIRAVVEVLREAGIKIAPGKDGAEGLDKQILDLGGNIEGWIALHQSRAEADDLQRHLSGSGHEQSNPPNGVTTIDEKKGTNDEAKERL